MPPDKRAAGAAFRPRSCLCRLRADRRRALLAGRSRAPDDRGAKDAGPGGHGGSRQDADPPSYARRRGRVTGSTDLPRARPLAPCGIVEACLERSRPAPISAGQWTNDGLGDSARRYGLPVGRSVGAGYLLGRRGGGVGRHSRRRTTDPATEPARCTGYSRSASPANKLASIAPT
jgi:hypothetical protein